MSFPLGPTISLANRPEVTIRFIEFDLDDLLVWSEPPAKAAWFMAYIELCAEGMIAEPIPVSTDTFIQFNGMTPKQVDELGLKIFENARNYTWARRYRDDICTVLWERGPNQKRKPGARSMLHELHDQQFPYKIVSASTLEKIKWKLEKSKLELYFDPEVDLIGGDGLDSKAQGFARGIEEVGCEPAETLVLGDSPADLRYGLEVGAYVAVVLSLLPADKFPADLVKYDRFLGFYQNLHAVAEEMTVKDGKKVTN